MLLLLFIMTYYELFIKILDSNLSAQVFEVLAYFLALYLESKALWLWTGYEHDLMWSWIIKIADLHNCFWCFSLPEWAFFPTLSLTLLVPVFSRPLITARLECSVSPERLPTTQLSHADLTDRLPEAQRDSSGWADQSRFSFSSTATHCELHRALTLLHSSPCCGWEMGKLAGSSNLDPLHPFCVYPVWQSCFAFTSTFIPPWDTPLSLLQQ